MGKSQRLGVREVRNIYRLLGECRDIGGAPGSSAIWREHMFNGLRAMVHAELAIGGEIWGVGTSDTQLAQTVTVGSGAISEKVWRRLEGPGAHQNDPTLSRFAKIKGRVVTRRRCQLLADGAWYHSRGYNDHFKRGGVDDRILSFCELPEASHRPRRAVNGITLYRAVGRSPFEPRDVGIVHLFHYELAPLLGKALSLAEQPGQPPLSSCLEQVLDGLLAGETEQQLADRLHRSTHTVHTHVKRLYRHFDVGSRAELLARFIKIRRQHGR